MGLVDELTDEVRALREAAVELLGADEIKAGLAANGWVLVHSKVLDEDIVWYRQGWGHLIPREVSEGRVCYRTDEIALLVLQRHTPDQVRAIHLVKKVFHRSLVTADVEPSIPISEHVAFVWKEPDVE